MLPKMAKAEAGTWCIWCALHSMKQRHMAEEGTHSPAMEALTCPFAAHALEWKEKGWCSSSATKRNPCSLKTAYKSNSIRWSKFHPLYEVTGGGVKIFSS